MKKHENLLLFTSELFNEYLKNDYVLPLLVPENDFELINLFDSNKWLLNTPQKRMIWHYVYGDLILPCEKKLKILDVGGGVNILQKHIAKFHSLDVIDILAHDNAVAADEFCRNNQITLIENDWFDAIDDIGKYDKIISTDMFPNVDQRLFDFLIKINNKATEIRLVLTFYQLPRYYKVKRVDADEIMCIKAWDGKTTAESLLKSSFLFNPETISPVYDFSESIFPNKRCVVMITKTLML